MDDDRDGDIADWRYSAPTMPPRRKKPDGVTLFSEFIATVIIAGIAVWFAAIAILGAGDLVCGQRLEGTESQRD